ncbi:hypothetical protein QUB11_22295 [Microcoleus sp. B6-A1]
MSYYFSVLFRSAAVSGTRGCGDIWDGEGRRRRSALPEQSKDMLK